MNRGNTDAAAIGVIVALAVVGVAVIVSWVIDNWELIVLGISTAIVVALFGLAVYLMVKSGAIRR